MMGAASTWLPAAPDSASSGWRSGSMPWAEACASRPSRAPEPPSNSACLTSLPWRFLMIRILIADDHGIVRTGLKLLLDRLADMQVIGEAADGREAVRLAAE